VCVCVCGRESLTLYPIAERIQKKNKELFSSKHFFRFIAA
jgi:hypothetical protein